MVMFFEKKRENKKEFGIISAVDPCTLEVGGFCMCKMLCALGFGCFRSVAELGPKSQTSRLSKIRSDKVVWLGRIFVSCLRSMQERAGLADSNGSRRGE